VVSPADASADATRFVAPADGGEDVTRVAVPDDELTVAAPSDPAGDAVTVATPVARTTHNTRAAGRRSKSDTGPLEVGQSFGPRYHIIRMLGVGGMGAVYQAWDAELGVAVAIKVIRPEVMEDPMMAEEVSRRFKRELLLARQVTHKNVVRIHDLGDIDGIKYITMSYVEGTDLATILKRDGKRSVRELLHVARAVINGLVAAHTAGVVHRDLKPANIMIGKDGEALIMDFGIAHSTGDASASSAAADGTIPEHLRRAAAQSAGTTVGAVVGTLEYMAPEQAKGQPIDQRADVYAFGLILYDAFLGQRRAASGASAVEELQRRMTSPPPPLQALVSDVPAPLAALIARCVEPDAEKRFQTSADVAAELDRLDEDGQLIPIRRTIGLPQMAAVVALLTVVFGGSWWYFREPPIVTHDPVSVLIADFANRTGDAALDHTLEPMLRRALEEATFVTAYERTSLRDAGVRPPTTLDDKAAQEIAIKQGLRVVMTGSIERRGNGYRISVTARKAVDGTEIIATSEDAKTKDAVLRAATGLMIDVREALGDDASGAAQQYAAGGLSTTSLEVVRLYANALEALTSNRFDDARDGAVKAVAIDPKFGIGYLFLSVLSRNTGRFDDQRKYLKEALSHLDDMTERERYTTRAFAALVDGDYEECRTQLAEQINRYPGVVTGRNQLALCLTSLRDMRGAVSEMRTVVKMMPGQQIYRDNLALYLDYASQFQQAEETAARPDRYAALAIAFSQLGRGDVSAAKATYERLKAVNGGATFAASGLGDISILEGRFAEAVRILRQGAVADLADKSPDLAAAKLAAAAYAELSRRQTKAAVMVAEEALEHSNAVKIRFLAGRIFAEAGDETRARRIIASLSKELYNEPQAYAKIVEALLALQAGNAAGARTLLQDANKQFVTWIGNFDLGRAALAAGATSQADAAFDQCLNARRGEALALFVDEEPTYAFIAPAFYYQGRSREALKNARFAEPYREYLRLRDTSREDPLVDEVRKLAARTTSGG
jgi:serine/threonine protein kinase